MRESIITSVMLLFASVLPAAEGCAQTPGEFRIYEENDELNPFGEPTDRYYTQGLRVEWLSPPRKPDGTFLPGIDHADWCSLLCGEGAREGTVNAGYAFGQNMYTPRDISIAAPQPNDRPWAGLLYASRIARISYPAPTLKAQRQDRIEVMLGIVGPASLAKVTQIGWHDLWGFQRPNGWDNQLKNEPVLQLRYETALRWPRREGGNADIVPRVRGNLGNALASVQAEVTGRIGWNLSGFGVSTAGAHAPAFGPSAEVLRGSANALSGARWLASGNFFLRAGVNAVAHNIFLDGNSFAANDIRIRRTIFVPELAAGVEVNLVNNFWLTFQFIRRGSEFKTRSGREAPAQKLGSITLGWTTSR